MGRWSISRTAKKPPPPPKNKKAFSIDHIKIYNENYVTL